MNRSQQWTESWPLPIYDKNAARASRSTLIYPCEQIAMCWSVPGALCMEWDTKQFIQNRILTIALHQTNWFRRGKAPHHTRDLLQDASHMTRQSSRIQILELYENSERTNHLDACWSTVFCHFLSELIFADTSHERACIRLLEHPLQRCKIIDVSPSPYLISFTDMCVSLVILTAWKDVETWKAIGEACRCIVALLDGEE